ncbi:leucine-rich repeat flightless-interacting protein 2-like [Styela clava]|uniref:leucine-rich repeat flightless-interacting protein 2-like n=1 Tax=Styela clava TaxID=7725 RepID=UPI001939A1CF|nr:leucine-rich repeat flightless-interacting protein 2-like [Styela clava]
MSSLAHTPSGRRRTERGHSAEDETLSQIAKEAEARLAQKRAARIEAREIRMRELERQQREAEEKAGKDGDDKTSKVPLLNNNNHVGLSSSISMLSRRSSDDSLSASEPSVRDMRDSLSEIEEKYKQAMVQNAQLDNERTQLNYRVEQLKDFMEEQEDKFYRLKKDYKEKSQELENNKRMNSALQKKYEDSQEALRQRDELIQEQGLVMVGGNMAVDGEVDSDDPDGLHNHRYTLLTQEAAQVLQSAGDGPLEVRLKKLAEEKQTLIDQVRRLEQELDEERSKDGAVNGSSKVENGVSDMMLLELQREAGKQISDYKFKLQKAEQEIGSCQANIIRLETQLQRYKATAEVLEKSEDEMRAEKRKLQRDLRAALDRIEEMEMTTAHLEKRLEKMRAARNAQANQT